MHAIIVLLDFSLTLSAAFAAAGLVLVASLRSARVPIRGRSRLGEGAAHA